MASISKAKRELAEFYAKREAEQYRENPQLAPIWKKEREQRAKERRKFEKILKEVQELGFRIIGKLYDDNMVMFYSDKWFVNSTYCRNSNSTFITSFRLIDTLPLNFSEKQTIREILRKEDLFEIDKVLPKAVIELMEYRSFKRRGKNFLVFAKDELILRLPPSFM